MTDRIERLKKILESEPDDAFCLYGLAMEYATAGDAEEALRLFDRAIAADPDFCYAYFHKARVQEEHGDMAGAAETLATGRAIAEAVGDERALNEIAAYLESLIP